MAGLHHEGGTPGTQPSDQGSRRTASTILQGVWLRIFVVFLGFLLRLIPTSALAAILVYTGYKLINPKSIKLTGNLCTPDSLRTKDRTIHNQTMTVDEVDIVVDMQELARNVEQDSSIDEAQDKR